MLKKIKIELQQDESDCGICCMSMLLQYYNSYFSYEQLRVWSNTDIQGTSAKAILETLRNTGLNTEMFKSDSKVIDSDLVISPTIFHVLNEAGYFHYILVYKISKKFVYYIDPAIGKIKKNFEDFKKIWTGYLIESVPSETYEPRKQKVKNKLFILNLKKADIFKIGISWFISLLNILFSIGISFYFKSIIDQLEKPDFFDSLSDMTLQVILLLLLSSLLVFARNGMVLKITQQLNKSLLLQYLHKINELNRAFFKKRKVGEITSRIEDIATIIGTTTNFILSTTISLVTIVVISFVMFRVNHSMFLVMSLSIPLYVLSVVPFWSAYNKKKKQLLIRYSDINTDIVQNVKSVDLIKTYNAQEFIEGSINKKVTNYTEAFISATKIQYIQNALKFVIHGMSSVAVLYLGGLLAENGTITIGTLVVFNSLLSFVLNSVQDVLDFQQSYQDYLISRQRVLEIMNIPPENCSRDCRLLEKSDFLIECQGVTLDYLHGRMKPIDLVIRKGEKIGFQGISGIGKSSFAQILSGLETKYIGKIWLNDLDISKIDLYSYREMFSYSPSEPIFLNTSLWDNLTLGKNVPESVVKEACRFACITDLIEKAPLGFRTIVGDNGNNLSKGQKQRLEIARALINDADVLIFDEITTGVEEAIKIQIIENLVSLKNKTILLISHDDEVIKKMDRRIEIL